ncbi:hypothetical protein Q5687_16695 [Microcoleus sp. AT10_D2]
MKNIGRLSDSRTMQLFGLWGRSGLPKDPPGIEIPVERAKVG